ncbi:crustapain-like [Hermetia illucens]|nr:crustapain-like [Hermetia illucens]
MEWSHLCLLIIIGLAVAKDFTEQEIQVLTKTPEELWEIYKEQYNKQYQSEEEESYRKGIVLEKYRKLKDQLELRNKSIILYTISISKYSDLSHKEFMEKMFGPENDQKAMYFKLSELMPKSISTSISLNSFLFITIILISYF